MYKIFEKWFGVSLIVRIFIGIFIGIILAISVPQFSFISTLGKIFINLLKSIAPLLVFILVLNSIVNASGKMGDRFRKVIWLYILSTFFAALAAVGMYKLFPLSIQLTNITASTMTSPKSIGDLFLKIFYDISVNPVSAIIKADYLAILFWSIFFGIIFKGFISSETRCVLSDLTNLVSRCVTCIIQFSPLGIMGIVFETISLSGISVLIGYAKLIALIVGCMVLVTFIFNPLIAYINLRKNPYSLLFQCLKESGLMAFFTRSSAANIPVNLKLCEKLGIDKDFYSVSIPLGATINMDGAAITITIMTLILTTTLGIDVNFQSMIFLSLMATFCSCGASGVPGGSLLMLPMACSLFGINNDIAMQMVAVGFINACVLDSFETALNSSADVLFTAVADSCEKEIKKNKLS